MATYVNDLRLKEIATGDESGTWGTSTNTNLELIAEAFSFGTEAITTNADTHTTTIADGSTDPGRSIYLKYTGTLDSACTITIGPNTVSKLWFIENGTSGSQNIIISQGSGANVTIPAGHVKAVYSDGAGSGAAMVDAFTDLNLAGTTTIDVLSASGNATIGGTLGVTGAITGTLATAAQPNITSVGTLTTLSVDNITINGNDISSTNSDGDLVFKGNDGGSTITALTLDMSDAGKATFNSGVISASDTDTQSVFGRTAIGFVSGLSDFAFLSHIDRANNSDYGFVQSSAGATFLNAASGQSVNLQIGGSRKLILDSSGNVGIGTTSPAFKLDVVGDVQLGNVGKIKTVTNGLQAASTSSDGFALRTAVSSAANPTYSNVDDTNTGMFFAAADTLGFTTGGTERMRIDSSGQVGIGCSPSRILDVEVSGGNAIGSIVSGTSNIAGFVFGDTSADDQGGVLYDNSSDFLNFRTGGAERVRIDSSGKVGIGTSSPSSILNISDTAPILRIDCVSNNDSKILFVEDNNLAASLFYEGSAGGGTANKLHIRSELSGGERNLVTIGLNGLVEINVNNNSHNFQAFASSSNSYFGVFDDANDSANIEIRRSDSAQVFFVLGHTGNYHFSGSDVSDRDLKENIEDVPNGSLELVKQLKPRTYNFKSSEGFDDSSRTGFIAQEVADVMTTDHRVASGIDGNKDMGIDPVGLIAHLTKAIQEQQTQIETLQSEINLLKGE